MQLHTPPLNKMYWSKIVNMILVYENKLVFSLVGITIYLFFYSIYVFVSDTVLTDTTKHEYYVNMCSDKLYGLDLNWDFSKNIQDFTLDLKIN